MDAASSSLGAVTVQLRGYSGFSLSCLHDCFPPPDFSVFAAESCMFLCVLGYRSLAHNEDLRSSCGFGVSQTGFLLVMLLQSLASQIFYSNSNILFSQFFPPWVISLNIEKVQCQKWGKEIWDACALT